MRTNIVIEEDLIEMAMRLSGLKTKRSAVEAGLRLLIQVHQQTEIRGLRGKVAWSGNLEEWRMGRIAENSPEYPPSNTSDAEA